LIQSPKFCHLRVSYFLTKFPSSSSRLSRWEKKKKDPSSGAT
jgi:DNA-binding transcriptional regulator YiaG